MMLNVLVTGASGFVGKRFIELNHNKYTIRTVSLRTNQVSDIDLAGIDCIVHLAAKVHEMNQPDANEYIKVNYDLTKQMADKAISCNVPHFIFLSTVKVYSDYSESISNEESPCMPSDAYGRSKRLAEEYLLSVAAELFKVAIVRPPMVYGPGNKGNMLKLLNLAAKKIPLPFGNINNRRTLVYVDNLLELITTVIDQKASGIFIPSDPFPVSTTELLSYIQTNMFNGTKLVAIPAFVRNLIKKIRPATYARLFGSSEYDNKLTRKALNYNPPYSSFHGIAETVRWFQINNNKTI